MENEWETIILSELQQTVGSESSVDLITIAQAMHWFDLPTFYNQVKWILKKPVIVAWCYTIPEVNPTVDSLFQQFYTVDAGPYGNHLANWWTKNTKLLISHLSRSMDLITTVRFDLIPRRRWIWKFFFTYLRSWSVYQTRNEKGVELLTDGMVEGFKQAWNEDGEIEKVVTYPVYLRIGKVGSVN